MSYLLSIKTAIVIFPLVALLFTMPFILHQYHKYGSINRLRVIIVYSFILYMMCIYFLVILPLPARNSVTKPASEMMSLVPFSFVGDFLKETSFVISDPSTYLKALTEPCVYTVLLNIIMTVPFGMYLRYYFECDLKTTVKLSFGLSLFFEVTQLTGLYFIYPHPYRLFDVDDLIMNTLGGALGYALMGLVGKILPSRREIDAHSLRDGTKVSGLRRASVFLLDSLICGFLSVFFLKDHLYLLIFLIYYLIVPVALNGCTLGSKFLNVKFAHPKFPIIHLGMRSSFLYLYYYIVPYELFAAICYLVDRYARVYTGLIYLIFLFALAIFYLVHFVHLVRKKTMFYDPLLNITYESTIHLEESD